jgi:hypothetical protein
MTQRIPRALAIKSLIASGLLVAAALSARQALKNTPDSAFGYDESDYMHAAGKGWQASYLDRPSVPFLEFASMGIRYGLQQKNFGKLSEFIRGQDDVTFYRHYHGPVYFYAILAARHFLGDSEKLLRQCSWILGLLVGIPLAVSYWNTSGRRSRLAAFGLALLPVFSPTLFLACANITPHVAFLSVALASLGAFSFYLGRETKSAWVLTSALCAVSLATFEYTPLLLFALVCGAFLHRQVLARTFGRLGAAKALGVFVLTQFVVILGLWAGAVAKLTIVKDYIFFAYFSVVRGGAYGANSLAGVWVKRLGESPFEWIFGFAALLLVCVRWKKNARIAHFAIFALLVFLVTVRNHSMYPQYVAVMIPVFFLLSVLSIETIESGIARKAILSLYVLGLIGGSVHFLQKPYASSAQKMDFPIGSSGGMRSVVRENGIDRLLVQSDYFPVFNYYFQDLEKSEFRIDGNRIENDRIGTFLGQGHAGKTGIIVSDRNRPVVEAELAAGNRRFAVKPLDRIFCIVVEGDAPATRLADRDALSSP